MENYNFNSSKFESSNESSGDKKDDKKKSKSAKGIGKLVAHEEQAPKASPEAEHKDERSLLQKLAGEPVAPKETEAETDDGSEVDREASLESISDDEEGEVAKAHIEDRVSELVAEGEADQTMEEAAETEANQIFLAAVQEHLESGSDMSVDEAVETAFGEVVADMSAEVPEEGTIEVADSELAADVKKPEAEPLVLDPDLEIPLASSVSPTVPRSPLQLSSARRPSSANTDEQPIRLNTAEAAHYERRGAARGLLVGGVVGYLVGRRKGEIKTEKRLKVVQEKIEKQVSEIQQKLEQKELVVRKMAREQVVTTGVAAKFAERGSRADNSESTTSNEKQTSTTPDQEPSQQQETAKAAVDSLSKEELLAFSSQIRVGETNLRRVFEANMVDEKGLRRLIKEYQAGKDLRRALAREFMVKELKFERDPTLRDLLPPEAQPRQQPKGNNDSVQYGEGAAAAVVNDIAAQLAATGQSSKSASPNDVPASTSSSRQHRTSVSSGVLVGLTLLTISLAIYAIWLTINK